MAWWLLLAASVVEIVMAAALKASDGWTKPWPSMLGIVSALASIFLLAHAIKHLPTGTAYAVWTGIGAVGVAIYGIAANDDAFTPARVLCLALVIAGVAGLRFIEA
ncbi:multidrug efflux SMR transporter [Flavobacterium sp. MXW15]|uniref:Guanidinium exporter n=1 Tax=Xanthomonas chitinilytica TaxID=2989819 RepID=A0ABT3JZN5_9XANT|nr:multidrug efflux SMR transporter [Xanthomonas sp. H13-6]MCW4456033.1 multidrug efflux SMR transporter [Flavobacterium sp. MXW15]MCW4473630.1 multidrug efflux SMR transporter [Xanthomonas sp. H13-6]